MNRRIIPGKKHSTNAIATSMNLLWIWTGRAYKSCYSQLKQLAVTTSDGQKLTKKLPTNSLTKIF